MLSESHASASWSLSWMRPLNPPHLSHLSSPPVSAPVPLKPNAPHLHGGVQQVFIWRTSKILKA